MPHKRLWNESQFNDKLLQKEPLYIDQNNNG